MVKRILFTFAILALAAASAKNYAVEFLQPCEVAGTKLKAGAYTMDLGDSKAVLTGQKLKAESAVKVERVPARFKQTVVVYEGTRVQEIRLGGTDIKVMFN